MDIQVLQEPQLGGRRRYHTHFELHSTKDKGRFVLDAGEASKVDTSMWPVYKGESFDLWTPDTGTYYASAEATEITEHLWRKRHRQSMDKRSVFHGLPASGLADCSTLVCLHGAHCF